MTAVAPPNAVNNHLVVIQDLTRELADSTRNIQNILSDQEFLLEQRHQLLDTLGFKEKEITRLEKHSPDRWLVRALISVISVIIAIGILVALHELRICNIFRT